MIRPIALLGTLLTLLGVAAYGVALAGETASVTALIPAFFGVPLLGLALAGARLAEKRRIFVGLALALAGLGLLGSVRGLGGLVALVTRPEDVARPAAVVVQSVMAVLCLAFLVLAAWSSFVARAK